MRKNIIEYLRDFACLMDFHDWRSEDNTKKFCKNCDAKMRRAPWDWNKWQRYE